MEPLNTILFSSERIKRKQVSRKKSGFEKNIQYIYQQNTDLLEKSASDVLQMKNLKNIKLMYNDFIVKSEYKINTFRKIQRGISEQPLNPSDDYDELFSVYLFKVSSYFKQQIIRSPKYQHLRTVVYCEKMFMDQVQKQFAKQIYKVSYRTLILDYNFQKEKGTIQGDSEEDRKQYYNQILLNDSTYITEFFNRFPCLLRIISNEIRKLKKLILELLQRYKKDFKIIAKKLLNKQSQNINYIDFGLGDAHCDGRRTTKIVLKEDIIIYKPRNASPDFFYAELMRLWNQKEIRYDIKCPNGIYRNNYSWFEYIEHEKCTNNQQIKNFYRRLGIQLAFLYALSATDFHFENIIAQNEFPILIDLECLFQIPNRYKGHMLEKDNNVQSIVEHKIATSVYAVGLLPTSLGENNIDISGIGSSSKIKSIRKVPQINTHTMKIEQKFTDLETQNKNKPILDDKSVEPYKYTKYILYGFKMGYMYIKDNQGELLRLIEKYKMNLQVRYLLKGTVDYTSILNLSVHPRLLHNYIDRELYISKMCTEYNIPSFFNTVIARDEFKNLINGDIPYYSNKITSRHLINSKQKELKNVFKTTPYKFVKQKIESFCGNDLEIQMDIIKCSMKLNVPLNKSTTVFSQNTFYNPDKIIEGTLDEKVIGIVQHIENKAIIGKGSNIPSWINISILDKKFHLNAMNDSLYDGRSGIALMYLSLWKYTREGEHLRMAEGIVHDIMFRMDCSKKDISIGAFTGLSSILYTVLNFYVLTNKAVYALYAKSLLPIIHSKLSKDDFLDVISGTAGALIVLIRYYELTRDYKILELAKNCGELLVNKSTQVSTQEVGWITIDKKPLSSFSHGNAGIIFALQLLNRYINSEKIKEVINKGLRYETNNKYQNGWRDLRVTMPDTDSATWCHGSAGILLSRLELQYSNDEYVINQSKIDINHALSIIKKCGFGKELNLCHGDIGNALILLKYAQHTKGEKWKEMIEQYFLKVIPPFILQLPDTAQPLGLMTGMAGIIYGFLMLDNPNLPNILTLELGKITNK